jgi:glycosyltransferase involved in cell wall biosynthesis
MERKDINISKTEIIKPRLLVLCQLFYPELVSTGQTLTELCEELAVRGVDVEVICGPATVIDRKKKIPKHINYKGIKIKRVWGTRFPKLNLFGRIINQITYAFSVLFSLLRDKSRRPILVLTNPPFLAFICALLRRLGSKPYIYLVFDVYPETATRLGLVKEKALIVKLWNLLNRFTFKHADKVIAIGRCMQELLMEKFGNLNNKLEIVHVWSDDKLIQSSAQKPNPLKEKWGIKDKFVITYSGNMGRFHDMETIMEAVKALKDNEKILFLFIGEGFKKRWMEDFARKYKLTNCRFFPGLFFICC